jgi:hypothetical protein
MSRLPGGKSLTHADLVAVGATGSGSMDGCWLLTSAESGPQQISQCSQDRGAFGWSGPS